MTRKPQRTERVRMALPPALLAVIALLAGLALVGGEWYVVVLFAVAILTAIVAAFAIRGKQWWWLIGLVPIIVLWNPVLPVEIDEFALRVAHIVASAFLVVAGLFITVPVEDDQGKRR